MAKRVGPQCEAAEYEDLSGEKSLIQTASRLMSEGAIGPKRRRHRGTLHESTNVGVKTGGSRVGGPKLCV